MASAALYFCGTAILAVAILLIPFVYKPASPPCECPNVESPASPSSTSEVDSRSEQEELGTLSQVQGADDARLSPSSEALSATEGEQDSEKEPPTEEKEAGAASAASSWRFELGQETKLSEEHRAQARQIGEMLKTQPKVRAAVIGLFPPQMSGARAKNAARMVRDEVSRAGISSKRLTTDVAPFAEGAGLVVVVELEAPR
jgi:hypothetical protein